MNLSVLDLDTPASYINKFDHILYAKNIWPTLYDDFKNGHSMYDEFLGEPNLIQNRLAKELQGKCGEVLRANYTHVMAYHACRTADPEQYRRLGLLSASQERRHAMARRVFTGIEDLDKALLEADGRYKTYEDSISMYISARFASTEYLHKGSHYLSMVVGNLAAQGNERLLSEYKNTKPFFVQCKIPVSWLEDSDIVKDYVRFHLYVGAVMRRYIWAKINVHQEYEESYETLGVFRDIPPENIGKILESSVCVNWQSEGG
jgi:hypothetical protein